MQQVREALGVTLSVLCSNIRLYHSTHHDNAYDGRSSNVDTPMKDESWVQFLTERAAEAVVNIQNSTQSDKVTNSIGFARLFTKIIIIIITNNGFQ